VDFVKTPWDLMCVTAIVVIQYNLTRALAVQVCQATCSLGPSQNKMVDHVFFYCLLYLWDEFISTVAKIVPYIFLEHISEMWAYVWMQL
jgi:hypothetical protein